MKSNNPELSIVIVSWQTEMLLDKCLFSLLKYSKNVSMEVFVVDNNSADNTVDMVQRKYPEIHLIANHENLGFAKANNQAIKLAKGQYILLLNPDTEFIENSLEKILSFMKNNSEADIAGCKILNSDLSLQESVRAFPTLYSSLVQLLKLHHIFPAKKILKKYLCLNFNYDKTQIVDQVMGAFLIYKKSLGFLDENYFLWLEEVDLCKRAKKVYYTPITKIIHHGGSSFKQVNTWQKQKYFYHSLYYFFKKHGL